MLFYSYTTVHVSQCIIEYTYVNLIMNTITDDSSSGQYVSLDYIGYTYHAATHTMRYLSEYFIKQ